MRFAHHPEGVTRRAPSWRVALEEGVSDEFTACVSSSVLAPVIVLNLAPGVGYRLPW
jgi:hypothetical protein